LNQKRLGSNDRGCKVILCCQSDFALLNSSRACTGVQILRGLFGRIKLNSRADYRSKWPLKGTLL